MKITTIGASEFKAKCLHLLDELEENGGGLIITKRGRPVAKVIPISAPKRSLRGTWKGLIKIKGDIVHCDNSEIWESNR